MQILMVIPFLFLFPLPHSRMRNPIWKPSRGLAQRARGHQGIQSDKKTSKVCYSLPKIRGAILVKMILNFRL